MVARAVRQNPRLVLGLPTGRTPESFYHALVRMHRRGRLDFGRVTTFNLDEFTGLAADDPRSYRAYMHRVLGAFVNLSTSRVHLPDGSASDWQREARRYDNAIVRAGGLDVAVIGIGANGHIGFNEPAPALEAATHLVRLRPESRRANAYLFGGRPQQVPTHALSMGIGTILRARTVVLLATGQAKAAIVARALTGPVTTRVPASLLQVHRSAVAVLDRSAAAGLAAAATDSA